MTLTGKPRGVTCSQSLRLALARLPE